MALPAELAFEGRFYKRNFGHYANLRLGYSNFLSR